ncbi:MAG: glycosyltransferase family 4 protein [Chthoniobacteraceae bacterium]
MKVAFDSGLPFALAHGGFQIQIEQTRCALARIGVDVDHMRWWDAEQRPDIIHWFGALNSEYVRHAHSKGIKLVLSELRTATGSRPAWMLGAQRLLTRAGRRLLPQSIVARIGWDIYQRVDSATALTECEARIMRDISECPPERLRVIPNGVEDEFFDTSPAPALDWLVCTATIHPRKRVLELARAAIIAQVPVWVIGRPYSEDERYHREFVEVARANPKWVRYDGGIDDRSRLAELYRGARGFVLISTMESQSLSALEAAASRCPLLLTDLPWARATFGVCAAYCPDTSDPAILARHLRAFWESDRARAQHFAPPRWTQVAEQLRDLYESLASTSR